MTPEQEDMVSEFLSEASAERRRGFTLERLTNEVLGLRQQVRGLSNLSAELSERVGRLERWRRSFKAWFEREARPHRRVDDVREPMPTIDPESAEEITLSGFGARAQFRGTVPLRLAIALAVIAGVGVAAYLGHSIVHPAAASSTQGVK